MLTYFRLIIFFFLVSFLHNQHIKTVLVQSYAFAFVVQQTNKCVYVYTYWWSTHSNIPVVKTFLANHSVRRPPIAYRLTHTKRTTNCNETFITTHLLGQFFIVFYFSLTLSLARLNLLHRHDFLNLFLAICVRVRIQ